MLARLDAVQANRPIDAAVAAPLLDEMSKRAQERLLLAQVVREIQVNLRRMEQVLDAFFRDHAKRAELATLAKDSRQVGGALRMLGFDQADRLLGALPGADRSLRRSRYAGVERRSRAARRIAVEPRLLRRGGRAAAA